MKTSAAGINLVKRFEGLELASYLCPAGKWTIGFGHTSAAGEPRVVAGMRITESEADEILRRDLVSYEREVRNLVKVPLAQNQFDALVSWHFNTGALAKSTLLKRLNAKEYDRVPAELMRWTRANGRELPGLVRRRRAETAMWRGLEEAPSAPRESRLTPDAPAPSKTITQSREANAAAATGALGGVAILSEFADKAQSISEALKNPTFVILLAICAAAAAIWFWRRQRLEEEGA